ncbi:VWA domain-containing protein [Rubripirellula sp.]|jgi:Ca-activated chloride channel family protein|nr:VWA domain-containing protein [Rubripirellula sp.]
MNDFEVNQINNLQLLWLIGLAAALLFYAARWKTRARQQFATGKMLNKIFRERTSWHRAMVAIVPLVAASLLVAALLDFRWGEVQREMPQKGIEVMFLLDVSKSMLAEDVSPNRLERAKQMIADTLDEMSGDRVGLTVFAGEARQRIPMTNHYDDFKLILNEVSPDDLATGGSRLGDAIRVAANGFLAKRNDHQVVVVLTDGEDQESEPVQVAQEMFQERGVRIYTIGLGDFVQGGRVPLGENGDEGYLKFEGEQVWSKLDGKVLEEVARATQGEYIPAGTKLVKMSDFYYGFLASMEQVEFAKANFSRLEARYQWFLGPAIAAVLFEMFLVLSRKKQLAN